MVAGVVEIAAALFRNGARRRRGIGKDGQYGVVEQATRRSKDQYF